MVCRTDKHIFAYRHLKKQTNKQNKTEAHKFLSLYKWLIKSVYHEVFISHQPPDYQALLKTYAKKSSSSLCGIVPGSAW